MRATKYLANLKLLIFSSSARAGRRVYVRSELRLHVYVHEYKDNCIKNVTNEIVYLVCNFWLGYKLSEHNITTSQEQIIYIKKKKKS